MPVLDDSMLFFGRGSLSFGTGMTLKMAVARFQQWAFSEGGLKEVRTVGWLDVAVAACVTSSHCRQHQCLCQTL